MERDEPSIRLDPWDMGRRIESLLGFVQLACKEPSHAMSSPTADDSEKLDCLDRHC